jgi:hypothetical protein
VQPFPATGAKYEIAPGGIAPVWSADGKDLIWLANDGFQIAGVTTRPSFAFGNPVTAPRGGLVFIGPSVQRMYSVTPDGRLLGIFAPASNAIAAPAPVKFQVVLGWFEELNRLVPTR